MASSDILTFSNKERPDISPEMQQQAKAYVAKAEMFEKKEEFDQSIEYFKKALALNPTDINLYHDLIYLLYRLRKHNETITYCDMALSWYPNDPVSYAAKAGACRGLKEYEKALKYYDKILELDPDNITVYQGKASTLAESGKYPEALEWCDKALKLKPKRHDNYLTKGAILINCGKYHEALECNKKALALKPNDPECYYNMAGVFYKLALYQLALDSCIKCLDIDPTDSKAHLLQGEIYYSLGKHQDAIRCFDQALSLDPNYPTTYISKANLLNDLGRDTEAMKCCDKAIELEPKNPDSYKIKGDIFYNKKQYQKVIKYYDKALALNPNNSFYYHNKSVALYEIGNYQKALECCKKSLAIDPNYPTAYCVQGMIYHKLGKHPEAIECYDKALSLDPNYRDAYINKANLLNDLDRHTEAIECCKEALAIDPSSTYALQFKTIALNGLREAASEQELATLIANLPLPEAVRKHANDEFTILQSLGKGNDDKARHLKYLKNLLALPWGKYDEVNINLPEVIKTLDQRHYGLEEVKNRILESLVVMAHSKTVKAPILCLVGAAGVGKTSIAHSIATALGLKCVSLPLGGASDSSLIRGFLRTYIGASYGKVLSLIIQAGTWNPIMVLDEIDKIDPVRKVGVEGAILALLDPEQNAKFADEYFDVTFNLSEVLFIVTANSLEGISYPLLNRMEIIEVGSYTDNEKLQIGKNYLLPKILTEYNLLNEKITISESIIKHLIRHYTKEPGVRDLEKLLRSLIQKYLVDKAKGKNPKITLKLIEQYFSTPKYQISQLNTTPCVGRGIGLAYTTTGGSTIIVEAVKFAGKGQIEATGKLGEVLKESVKAAFTYLKSKSKELAINEQEYSNYDVHIHLPEGAIAKDGPSAGITIYTAIASLFTGRKVRQDIAMTGEITLSGKVLAIGGLKEKLAAAAREGIKTVIIPKENKRDLVKIPAELKQNLTIKTISNASELLEIMLI